MAHALLAPSSLDATEKCPGRAAAIALLPASTGGRSSPAAARGTLLHDLLVKCVEQPNVYVARNMVGAKFPTEAGAYTLTDDDAAALQMVVTYYQTQEAAYGAPGQYEVGVSPGAAAHVMGYDIETGGVTPAPVDYSKECNGTADAVFHGRGYLEVADAKFGRVDVREDSMQVVAYALGALKTIELTPETAVQRVRTTIVQPNGTGQRIRTREWELDELMEQAVRLGNICEAALAPDAPRIPGEYQCRWCDYKPLCPEHAAAMGKVVDDLLDAAPTVNHHPTENTNTMNISELLTQALSGDDDALSTEAMVAVLEAAPMLRSWLTSVEQRLLDLALSGTEVPGMKVVQGSGKRVWSIAEDELLKKMGNWGRIGEDGKVSGKLKREDYTEVKVLSAPQAEKRIKPLVTPKTWANIEQLIIKQPGKPTLVPITDNRPPLRLTADEALGGEEEVDLSFLS